MSPKSRSSSGACEYSEVNCVEAEGRYWGGISWGAVVVATEYEGKASSVAGVLSTALPLHPGGGPGGGPREDPEGGGPGGGPAESAIASALF